MTEVKMTKILRAANLRVTRLRLAVLAAMLKAAKPISHADLQNALPDADRVTLYRTLTAFAEAGVAHQVQGLDGAWRFCAHTGKDSGCPGNHPHFLCTVCGTMTCLLDQTMPRVFVPEGYEVDGKQFVAYGKCPGCKNKKSTDERESVDKT